MWHDISVLGTIVITRGRIAPLKTTPTSPRRQTSAMASVHGDGDEELADKDSETELNVA